MTRISATLGLAALAVLVPSAAQAQYYVPAAPVYAPPIVASYPAYAVPRVSYYPAPVAYSVPSTAYYAAPVVQTTYAAPVVQTYSAYPAPVVAPAPGVYTTYTYRNGLGIFRPRYVNRSYYSPVYP